MNRASIEAAVAGLGDAERITPDDVKLMRGEIFRDGVVTRGEAEALFALDRSRDDSCSEWTVFLAEAITDFVVRQERPAGYVSDEQASWLMEAISDGGIVRTPALLELLVRIIEVAETSPPALSAFALKQVAHAVVEGEGALACGRSLESGVIGEPETELIRRILYAFGGDGNVGISRTEAEVLFDIADRTASAPNHPAWNDLFVKAVASSILCASGYVPPSRREALGREASLEKLEPDLGSFFARMVNGGLKAVIDAYVWPNDLESGWARRNRATAASAAAAETVDSEEAAWLVSRIDRDGILHENEASLLAFIRREARSVAPELEAFLARAG